MFSCDYNGWTDVPEEEREAIEAFEAALRAPRAAPVALVVRAPALLAHHLPVRRAA